MDFLRELMYIMNCHKPAGVVELVDTRDLKSLGRKAMTVRFRLPA